MGRLQRGINLLAALVNVQDFAATDKIETFELVMS